MPHRKNPIRCIDCATPVKVTRTIPVTDASRLQKIECPNCGRCGTVQVSERVDWLPKATGSK